MSKSCLIISGGERSGIPTGKFDYIIACDKGYEYALEADIQPDLIIGDFDSYDIQIHALSSPIIKLPTAKNDTDTGYAVKHALSQGYDEITIVCALGGRFDHSYSNIQTGKYAASQGALVTIIGAYDVMCIFQNSEVTLTKNTDYSLSVFALSDECQGVNISGAQYDLHEVTLSNDFPIGQSNEWKEDTVTVSVRNGILMIVESLF